VTYGDDDDDVAVLEVRRGEKSRSSRRSAAVPRDHRGKMIRGSTVVIVEVKGRVVVGVVVAMIDTTGGEKPSAPQERPTNRRRPRAIIMFGVEGVTRGTK